MHVAVMAAGGLGGYFGAVLARNGHDVTFIARGAQLKAIRERGLTIRSVAGDFQINPAKVTDDPAEIGPVDWVLFAVKMYDNPAAIQAIRPLVRDETAVITFQNGVSSPEELGKAFGMEHILIAPTQIVSNIVAPGVIEQKSPFRTMFVGEVGGKEVTDRVKQIVGEFQRAGINADSVPDGLVPMWDKFLFLASMAGLATLARTAPHDLFLHPEASDVLRIALEEAYLVGKAWGVALGPDTVERWHRFALKLPPGNKPSMLLDLEAGKRLEIDALSGAVVRLGAQKGIPTPVHQTIYAALKREDERAQARGLERA
jgi:2-dehydropantoate 2-reductase